MRQGISVAGIASATILALSTSMAAAQEPAAETGNGQAQSGQSQEQARSSQRQEQSLKIYFGLGTAAIPADQEATLDRAARTFRTGDPFVMTVTGGADTVGPAWRNLDLSLQRATAVVEALTARGIPVGRLQIVGRGSSELEVDTGDGVANRQNRVVEITWR